MKLKNKISLLTISFIVAMLLILASVSTYSFRQLSLMTAKDHARSAAEVVRVSLTEAMINGVIDKRASFLQRLAEVEGLKDVRVLRALAVDRQFGHPDAIQPDGIEVQVMASATPYYSLTETGDLFRATIPYIASNQGMPNCLACHAVDNGSVLGVITITISIDALRHQALTILSSMFAVLATIALIFLMIFRRQMNPIIETAQGVQQVVHQARLGEFSGRIDDNGGDEVAQIARDLNRLMNYLQDRLGETCKDVASLMKYELPKEIDLIRATTDMVAGLVDVSKFKQEIEGDQTQLEIYHRIAFILSDHFKIGNFSIYETQTGQNRLIPIVVDKPGCTECRWCDPHILYQADSCRALRTGHIIDAIAQPRICSRFNGRIDDRMQHICLPVIHSGSVGCVVQLVFNGKHSRDIYRILPLILVYLRESSSVVEAKRLMSALRETTLRDAMTGLRNRRFLEEYASTLIIRSQRSPQKLSVMMMDLDKFKSVNDTYGHEAGDIVLKTLAEVLRNAVRDSDLVIRYGGEEFLVILQESGDDYSGNALAEKIRDAVAKKNIRIPSAVLHKTLSIGVAHYPQDSEDFWEVVKHADSALYQAKNQGRNRVIHWQADHDAAPEEAARMVETMVD